MLRATPTCSHGVAITLKVGVVLVVVVVVV